MPILDNRELIERQPIIIKWTIEINQVQQHSNRLPISGLRLNWYAFDHQVMQPMIL